MSAFNSAIATKILTALSRSESAAHSGQQSGPMLVVIDAGITAPEVLAAGVQRDAQVVLLDVNRDGVAQITQALVDHGATRLHIFCHGVPGRLFLGNTSLSLANLTRYTHQLQEWGIDELLLYGCRVAAGAGGAEFLAQLQGLTGAGIAAATQPVGQAALGGCWRLDVQLGSVRSGLAITPRTQATYPGVFNTAPSFSGDGVLDPILEDALDPLGASIDVIFSGLFVDPDQGADLSGVAIVGNRADPLTEGVYQYSTNGGTTFFDVGAVGDDATALVLSASTLIRFVPVADYNGTPPSLVVRALDDTYGGGFTAGSTRETVDSSVNGGGTAIAGSTNEINANVTAINDAPNPGILYGIGNNRCNCFRSLRSHVPFGTPLSL